MTKIAMDEYHLFLPLILLIAIILLHLACGPSSPLGKLPYIKTFFKLEKQRTTGCVYISNYLWKKKLY
jgi:hypothetical protein